MILLIIEGTLSSRPGSPIRAGFARIGAEDRGISFFQRFCTLGKG